MSSKADKGVTSPVKHIRYVFIGFSEPWEPIGQFSSSPRPIENFRAETCTCGEKEDHYEPLKELPDERL